MKQKNNNLNLKIFRNIYSLVIGGPTLVYLNYSYYFGEPGFLNFIPFFLIMVFYYPLYLGILWLLFKFDFENSEKDFEIIEAVLLWLAIISLGVALFYLIFFHLLN